MLKIRLMRIGTKRQPFYRVVAVDERKKRSGAYLELLGTYNPLTEPKQINLKQDRIDEWIKKGAILSDGFLRIIGKAPQRLPRKPKKEKGTKTSDISSQTTNQKPLETAISQDETSAQKEIPAQITPETEQPISETIVEVPKGEDDIESKEESK